LTPQKAPEKAVASQLSLIRENWGGKPFWRLGRSGRSGRSGRIRWRRGCVRVGGLAARGDGFFCPGKPGSAAGRLRPCLQRRRRAKACRRTPYSRFWSDGLLLQSAEEVRRGVVVLVPGGTAERWSLFSEGIQSTDWSSTAGASAALPSAAGRPAGAGGRAACTERLGGTPSRALGTRCSTHADLAGNVL